MSFKEAADKGGAEALKDMIAYGSVVARRHTLLPPTSSLRWPWGQQVHYVTESTKEETEAVKIAEAHTEEPTMGEAEFDAEFRVTGHDDIPPPQPWQGQQQRGHHPPRPEEP